MSKENNSVSPSEMDVSKLPDVPAFQDEFTREFLQSVEPVENRYYPFKSKTESFTMFFPADFTIDKRSYNVGPENNSEFISMSQTDEQKEAFVNHRIDYINYMSDPENSRERMRNSSGQKLEFEEINTDFKKQHLEVAEYESGPFSVIAALIWNENNQGITIFSDIDCREDLNENQCLEAKDTQRESIMDMIKSIQFSTNEESE
ncbi:hypothetical protein AB1K91_15035 [Terribacillus sp. 179-K 1B1 HS]|uniref:hypothetical protein n=1 Tax=Terribacillus sp. 179-K 1B1 HS TaxID=3142388 RepID=UPI0039A0E64C